MDEVSNQNIGQLPIPAVEGIKKDLADFSRKLSDDCTTVSVLFKKLERENIAIGSTDEIKESIRREKDLSIFIFYETVERIMNSTLQVHLAAEDTQSFKEYFDKLNKETMNPELYELETIHEYNRFLQGALKNSNLLELGIKSCVKDQMQEIVDDGL
jgi:hypothetical protein